MKTKLDELCDRVNDLNAKIKSIPVRICDPEHPHYPETGELTGKMISLFGQPMAEMKLDNCEHGDDACFVSKGQVESLK